MVIWGSGFDGLVNSLLAIETWLMAIFLVRLKDSNCWRFRVEDLVRRIRNHSSPISDFNIAAKALFDACVFLEGSKWGGSQHAIRRVDFLAAPRNYGKIRRHEYRVK